ncbi:MAG: hypothetical protein M5U26_01860 [Planctomycetota bacterium]|nr:hypothetical protein [Planctomycetota bacterium]
MASADTPSRESPAAQAAQAADPARLLRSAWIVNGLALAFCALGFAGEALFGPYSEEGLTFLGLCLAATGCLIVWASLLLLKAWRRGERARAARLLILALLFEACAPMAYTWYLFFARALPSESLFLRLVEAGLPAFVPFVALGSFPVGWLAGRCAGFLERRRRARGQAGMSPRRRFACELAFFTAGLLALGWLVLPAPLVLLFCVYPGPEDGWRAAALKRAPAFQVALLDGTLEGWGDLGHGFRKQLYETTARLPDERIRRALDSHDLRVPAMFYATRHRPALLLELPDSADQAKLADWDTSQLELLAVSVLSYAEPGAIRRWLFESPEFNRHLRRAMASSAYVLLNREDEAELRVDVVRAIRELPDTFRTASIQRLAYCRNVEGVVEVYTRLLELSDGDRWYPVLGIAGVSNHADIFERLTMRYLPRTDAKGALIFCALVGAQPRGRRQFTRDWLAAMLKRLDDPDLATRRKAAHLLALANDLSCAETPGLEETVKDPLPLETPREEAEREAIRKFTQELIERR